MPLNKNEAQIKHAIREQIFSILAVIIILVLFYSFYLLRKKALI